ncbi:MAG TPA: hypothetical protein DEA73_07315 [Peptococcaceae bacterium]|nr:MAG: hypothetical protein XD51_0149 [Moorella sp. 60_41]HBT47667.1 hypothetical protein [Peptococcaceae bacterium]
MNVAHYKWLRESELALLVCLVPVYGEDGGNYTEVWFENNRKQIVQNRVKTVTNNLVQFLGANPRQGLAAWHRGGRRHAPPIVLTPSLTLVALPVRRPLYRDQGGIGYVVLQKISTWEAVEEGDFRTRLLLAGDHRLNCLLKRETLELRLLEAARVSHRSRELFAKLSRHPGPQTPFSFDPDDITE